MAEPSVITIRTPGLSLPEPGASRETYTRAERVSVATLALVAAKALRLVSTNRNRHKIVLLDEAWFFLSSAQGRALLNRLIRLARAFNATVLVATQRLADLGDLSELFGVYLLFGQETEAEAAAGLAQIGLNSEGALRIRLTEYRQGECLIRDLDGRVGEAQVDPVFAALLDAFDSTPGRHYEDEPSTADHEGRGHRGRRAASSRAWRRGEPEGHPREPGSARRLRRREGRTA
jgi:hypothetical protein